MTSQVESTFDGPAALEPTEEGPDNQLEQVQSLGPVLDEEPTQIVERQEGSRGRAKLERPAETNPVRIAWGHAVGITSIHLLACLAFLPYFFSWTGVVLMIAGHFVFGLLGITLCYHRILTHRGMVLPKPLEHFFAVLGICCMQESPARWVAIHRIHHKHSDDHPDPHSPLVNLLWGHVGWLYIEHREHSKYLNYENYARDILRDRFYARCERRGWWMWIYAIHAALFYLVGFVAGWAMGGNVAAGVQFGASLLVWGVFVRTVVVWHLTWSVNSLAHIWGYRNYETRDDSRNNWLVGLMTHGEGWHNNHHADQRSARHGHRWYEFDCTWLVVLFLEKTGLAKNVVRPKSRPD